MAKQTNAFQDEPTGGLQHGRGGFLRGANDTPYITDPNGGIVKSGERKGEPKRTPYASPSNFGKLVENTHNLQKWSERRILLGIGVDLALIADCARLATLDVDSDDYKTLADRIVVAAMDAAKASLAAERGTHTHAVLEDDDEGRNWLERAEAGELLGIPVEAQRALVEGWRMMLAREVLEVLVTEASCVDDNWRCAGTLDNLARLGKSLRFRLVTGEIRTIPAGTVVVLDKKSGARKLDRDGVVQYWHGYSVQVASYAQSRPYDTEAETRGEWAWTVDQTHALIAHVDVAAAIAGATPADICSLVYVDLVAGREHGGRCVVDAKAWGARTDLFSVAQLDDEAVPEAPPSKLRKGQLERAAIDAAADAKRTPPVEPVAPDEGVDLSGSGYESAWKVLQDQFTGLPRPALAWTSVLIKDARDAGVPFQAGLGRTGRRFGIYRGLIPLALHSPDDDALRALVALAMGSDAPLFPSITAGHALGSLDAAAAECFALLVDAYLSTPAQLVVTFDDAGTFRLAPVEVAA